MCRKSLIAVGWIFVLPFLAGCKHTILVTPGGSPGTFEAYAPALPKQTLEWKTDGTAGEFWVWFLRGSPCVGGENNLHATPAKPASCVVDPTAGKSGGIFWYAISPLSVRDGGKSRKPVIVPPTGPCRGCAVEGGSGSSSSKTLVHPFIFASPLTIVGAQIACVNNTAYVFQGFNDPFDPIVAPKDGSITWRNQGPENWTVKVKDGYCKNPTINNGQNTCELQGAKSRDSIPYTVHIDGCTNDGNKTISIQP